MTSLSWEIAEWYVNTKYGVKWQVFAINQATPVKSVRENVARLFGGHVKVSNGAAKEIIGELEAYGYKWMTHEPTGTTFMAGDPDHLITAAASVIEM